MKRKIGLLLAAIMALSTVPATAVSAATIRVDAPNPSTLVREHKLNGFDDNRSIEAFMTIKTDTWIPAGTEFQITLEGAKVSGIKDFYFEKAGFPRLTDSVSSAPSWSLTDNPAEWRVVDGDQEPIATGSAWTLWNGHPDGTDLRDRIAGSKDLFGEENITSKLTPNQWFPNAGVADIPGVGRRTVWTNIIHNAPISSRDYVAQPDSVVLRRLSDTHIAAVLMKDIPENTWIRLPLPIEVTATEGEQVKATVSGGSEYFSATDRTFVFPAVISGRASASTTIAVGNETIRLNPIRIDEQVAGRFTANVSNHLQVIELTPPDGYRFVNAHNVEVTQSNRDSQFRINKPADGDTVVTFGGRNNEKLYVGVSVAEASRNLASYIEIENLAIEPDRNRSINYNTRLSIGISSYDLDETVPVGDRPRFRRAADSTSPDFTWGKFTSISQTRLEVAEHSEQLMTLSVSEPVSLKAGQWHTDWDNVAHITNMITLEELDAGIWASDRETRLILPEGVLVRGIHIDNVRPSGSGLDTGRLVVNGNASDFTHYTGTNGNVTIEGNEVRIRDFNRSNSAGSDRNRLRFRLSLSISPDFEGDLDLLVTGAAIPRDQNELRLTIAEVERPLELTTRVTTVRIGSQSYEVSKVTIQENYAGALRSTNSAGGDFALSVVLDDPNTFGAVTTSSSLGVQFTNVVAPRVEVTEGDIEVGYNRRDSETNRIAFDVNRTSTEESKIEISNLHVIANRSAHYGDYSVALTDGGSGSFFSNSNGGDEKREARFNPYVLQQKFVTVSDVADASVFSKTLTINAATGAVSFDGEPVEMASEFMPYISPRSNSFLVSLRFVSEVFGAEAHWDDATRTATIVAPNRTVQFTAESATRNLSINNGINIPATMFNENGEQVVTEVTNSRMFVPLRALAEAFGITDVNWDNTSQVATLN